MNPFSTITLLIADDEAEIRSGLRSIIPWEDYSVSVVGTAAGGSQALDMIRYYEPDIVITDIQMPGMNGLELVRRAREEQFQSSFVILSGYDDFEYARTAIRYGVSEYLLKPISIKELTVLIEKLKEEILSRRRLQTDQLSTLRKLRRAQVSLGRHNIVPQLLRGELTHAKLCEIIGDYSLQIKDKESCAVLIQAFSPRQNAEESGEAKYLAPLKEAFENELKGFPILLSEYPPAGLLLIVNLPFSSPHKKSLKDFLEEYIKRAEETAAVQIRAAIGMPAASLPAVHTSFQDAKQAITWHIYPEMGRVLEADLLTRDQPPVIMPGDGILEAILRDSTEEIKNSFFGYLEQLLAPSLPPPSYIYGMCNYLIITLQSKLSSYLDGPPKSYAGNSFAALQSLSSLEEIREFMISVLLGFAEEVSVSRAAKNDPLIEKAIAYIHENLLKNPRTEEVCSYLGLSKSYFSTYFKNKTKVNFRDYTLNLKINYAQEQLKHPEHSPGEVSVLLCYEDYRSFSRAFKARTGLTPSDYQKQYTSEERSGL